MHLVTMPASVSLIIRPSYSLFRDVGFVLPAKTLPSTMHSPFTGGPRIGGMVGSGRQRLFETHVPHLHLMEGRMEGKRGRERQKLMDWMMEGGYGNSGKRHNIEKSGVVRHLDLPGGIFPNPTAFSTSKYSYTYSHRHWLSLYL